MNINYQTDECIIVTLTKDELNEIARRLYVERVHSPIKTVKSSIDLTLGDWQAGRESEVCHLHGSRGGLPNLTGTIGEKKNVA